VHGLCKGVSDKRGGRQALQKRAPFGYSNWRITTLALSRGRLGPPTASVVGAEYTTMSELFGLLLAWEEEEEFGGIKPISLRIQEIQVKIDTSSNI